MDYVGGNNPLRKGNRIYSDGKRGQEESGMGVLNGEGGKGENTGRDS